MKREYIFKKDLLNFKSISNFDSILRKDSYVNFLVSSLVYMFSGEKVFALKEEKNEQTYYLDIILKRNINLKIVLLDDKVKVITKPVDYVFNHDYDGQDIKIDLKEIYFKDNKLREIFKTHELDIELVKNNKKLKMHIPIDIYETLNPNFFELLKDNATLIDLKKFYETNFKRQQQNYDLNKETILTIEAENEDYILGEKLTLQNGLRVNYQIAKTYKKNAYLTINLTKKAQENIKISIDNMQVNSSVNLNQEVKKLILRANNIK